MKALLLTIQNIWTMLKFKKVSQISRSRSQGQNLLASMERSCHKEYTHMKYKSPITCHSNDAANVNF
jgi:hypothetical protein